LIPTTYPKMNKRSLLVRKLQLREHDELKIIIHLISWKYVGFFFENPFWWDPSIFEKIPHFSKKGCATYLDCLGKSAYS